MRINTFYSNQHSHVNDLPTPPHPTWETGSLLLFKRSSAHLPVLRAVDVVVNALDARTTGSVFDVQCQVLVTGTICGY